MIGPNGLWLLMLYRVEFQDKIFIIDLFIFATFAIFITSFFVAFYVGICRYNCSTYLRFFWIILEEGCIFSSGFMFKKDIYLLNLELNKLNI